MRNVSVVAIVALVGVLGFSAQAKAQGNDLTDVEGWWALSELQVHGWRGVSQRRRVGRGVHQAGTDGDSPR